jgi:formamidopyrimidine-DNA glycosylase
MPELPDITAYLSALEPRILGQPLTHLRIASPFLLRTVQPRIEQIESHTIRALHRIGKRIVFEFDNGLWLVLHLMIAGRLHWRPLGAKLGGRNNLAAFDFPNGSLVLTEAGSKRRASLHLFANETAAKEIDPGGIELFKDHAFTASLEVFRTALTAENRTLKRALTDPRILSGIGNAYSDEILHAAQLSPSSKLTSSPPSSGSASTTPLATPCNFGSTTSTPKPRKPSLKKSPPSAKTWQSTAASANPAPPAANPSSASATPTTRPTTAPSARPAAKSSPTAASHASSAKTGPAPSTSSKPSKNADP